MTQDSKKKRVLIIDDDGDLLEVLLVLLEEKGFLVDMSLDGQAGLAKVKSFKPDVILLDIFMPGMDGWEVCTKIRKVTSSKGIPVIMFTAHNMQDFAERALNVGASRIVEKSVDYKELVKIINECIGD